MFKVTLNNGEYVMVDADYSEERNNTLVFYKKDDPQAMTLPTEVAGFPVSRLVKWTSVVPAGELTSV